MLRPFRFLSLAVLLPLALAATPFWGADGHQMAARAATAALPDAMPGFFLDAAEQLVYLNPEPDRWRDRELQAMDQAFGYDHYIDRENVPDGALEAPDRFTFLRELHAAGIQNPARDVGFLPYRILELYQRLYSGWVRWYEAESVQERTFIEDRILNDAGVLGHYVTDASQPHHTTIHFNGWNASSGPPAPNPEGFTESRDFHGRFESGFVRAHVRQHHVSAGVGDEARDLGDPDRVRAAVMAHLDRSHDKVVTLYRLERYHGFDPEAPATPETVDFTADRLASGAEMLRDMWWTAWVQARDRPRDAPGS